MAKNGRTRICRGEIAGGSTCNICHKSFENIRPPSLSEKLVKLHIKQNHPEIQPNKITSAPITIRNTIIKSNK